MPVATDTKITARLVSLTPQLADQLLLKNTHNRAVRLAVVDQYAADMRKGDWQINGEAIKIAVDGQILDGQHRLLAVLEAQVAVDTLMITGLPPETQETMDQGRARTFADVLRLRGEHDYNVLAAATRIVCLYEQHGAPYTGGQVHAPSVRQLSRTLDRNPEIRDSCKFAGSLRRSWLAASPLAGMHYLFTIADQADADDFMRKLATGENINRVSPIYVLRERLIKEYSEGGLRDRVKLAFIARSWNAYRQGETIARLVFNPGGSSPDRYPEIDGLADGRRGDM